MNQQRNEKIAYWNQSKNCIDVQYKDDGICIIESYMLQIGQIADVAPEQIYEMMATKFVLCGIAAMTPTKSGMRCKVGDFKVGKSVDITLYCPLGEEKLFVVGMCQQIGNF